MNSDDGKVIGTQYAPMRTDQVLYDTAAHRLYVPGGQRVFLCDGFWAGESKTSGVLRVLRKRMS